MALKALLPQSIAACLVASYLAATSLAAESMTTTDTLLKDTAFKAAYSQALGARVKEQWLAKMTNSALLRDVTVEGDRYQVATPCKPHDCADNNLLVLYSPAKKAVYGKLYEKGKTTFIGAPSATMTKELEKQWQAEFRQR